MAYFRRLHHTFFDVLKFGNYTYSKRNTFQKLFTCEGNLIFYMSVKNFSQTRYPFQKIYIDAENSYAYQTLLCHPSYANKFATSINKLDCSNLSKDDFENTLAQNWRKETATSILKAFKKVYSYAKENNIIISDVKFDNLVDGLMDRCQDLTDEELSEFMMYLNNFPRPESLTSHNFHDIWSALDDICCDRLPNWSRNKILLFANYWYLLGLTKYIDYTTNAITRLSRKSRHLTREELVQTLFYINIRRKPGNMFDLECQIEKYACELSVDELAVISMGYFKTKTAIKSIYLLDIMLDKLIEETTTVNEVTLAAILKIVRYSPHLPLVDKMKKLLNKLVPEIDRFSILCCVHIALLGTITQFFHPDTLTRIAQKFVNNISEARLKDIERITFALTLYNYNPKAVPTFYNTVLNELRNSRRQSEFLKYPRSLSCCVYFLTLQEIFPYDLISKVLAPEFLKNAYGKNQKKIGREILFLDCLVEIDCTDYNGNRLNNKLRQSLAHWLTDWTPEINQKYSLTSGDKLFLDVKKTVHSVHGENDYVHVNYILPQFQRPDIIICKNKDGSAVEINHFSKYRLGDIMKPANTSELKWYVFIPGHLNLFIRDTTQLLGTGNTKVRQLSKIGFIPIVIPSCEYVPLTEQEKKEYIQNKIKQI